MVSHERSCNHQHPKASAVAAWTGRKTAQARKGMILSVLKIPIPLRKEELKSNSSISVCQCSCHNSSWVATVSAYS